MIVSYVLDMLEDITLVHQYIIIKFHFEASGIYLEVYLAFK